MGISTALRQSLATKLIRLAFANSHALLELGLRNKQVQDYRTVTAIRRYQSGRTIISASCRIVNIETVFCIWCSSTYSVIHYYIGIWIYIQIQIVYFIRCAFYYRHLQTAELMVHTRSQLIGHNCKAIIRIRAAGTYGIKQLNRFNITNQYVINTEIVVTACYS